jgi:hypothetical protein
MAREEEEDEEEELISTLYLYDAVALAFYI